MDELEVSHINTKDYVDHNFIIYIYIRRNHPGKNTTAYTLINSKKKFFFFIRYEIVGNYDTHDS